MPAINRQQCTHCGHQQEIMDHQDYFDGDGFVPLLHPGETSALLRLGVKEQDALLEGRIYWVFHFVCLDCHAITTKREVRLPDFFSAMQGRAEQISTVFSVLVGALILFFLRWPLYIVLPVVLLLMIGFRFAATARAKRIAHRRAAPLATDLRARGSVREDDACHHCGGTRMVDYLRFVTEHRDDSDPPGQPMRCPRCNHIELYHDYTYRAIS
jgi:hypothetical protein